VSGSTRPVEGEEMSESEAIHLYETALNEAAAIAGESVSKGFEASRRRTVEEFKEFLEKVGRGVGLENASDLDVIAFIQGWWLPAHLKNCRTVSGSGEKVASASSVKGVIQHLAKTYSMRGRRDGENPAKQESVRSYCEGYRNRLHANGVREKRAKLFQEGKVEDLIAHLERRIDESCGLTRCVQRMDLTAVLYLLESWCRGKECGELQADQVNFETTEVMPGWSKTVRHEPSACIELQGEGRGRFMESAARLVKEMESEGHGMGRGYLFRPVNRSRTGFDDSPLSAAALRKRVQHHLQDAGIYEGETLHTFRRSAVQGAAKIEGYDVKKLMEFGRWKSYSAFRIYVEEIESSFSRR
jgi:integrase